MRHLFFLLTLSVVFSSCKKDDGSLDSTYFKISPSTQYIHNSANGGQTSFNIKSNTSWSINYANSSSGTYGSLDILSVEPSSGKGDQTIIVRFGAIPSGYGGARNTITLKYWNNIMNWDSQTSVQVYSYRN